MVSDGLGFGIGWSGMGLDANNYEDNDDDDSLHQPTPPSNTEPWSPL